MATKRKRMEPERHGTVHASRQFQVYGSNPNPAKKPRRSEPSMYKQQAHASSVSAIKKRIRGVTRKLERSEDLPANVRVDCERALATYQQELAAAEAEKTKQKMIKKYHMVRFFERKKATRQLKKLRKLLLETHSAEEVEVLNKQIHVAEVDLNYTQYCPLSEVYVSLYPPKSQAAADEESSKVTDARPKPPMWAEVEKCMEEGTLDRLRNRTVISPIKKQTQLKKRPPKPKPKPEATPVGIFGRNRRERRNQGGVNISGRTKNKSVGFEKNQAFGASQAVQGNRAEDDENSDGGFFEE